MDHDRSMDRSKGSLAYWALNGSTAPCWLAMIVAPESKWTRSLMRRSPILLGVLGAIHCVLVIRGRGSAKDLFFYQKARQNASTPEGFIATWLHLLGFDLFVGRWIWEQGLSEARSVRLPLAITWAAGPTGLLSFFIQRELWRRQDPRPRLTGDQS
jgi:hypothetical protein